MRKHHNGRLVYERPQVVTYGTLRDMTAQLERALPAGIGVAGVPTSGPTGGPPPGGPERPPPGPQPETNPPSGFGGEESAGGGGGGVRGESGVGGAELGGGGGGGEGGGGTVSGGAAELPFTGFPAAVAAVAGAGMTAAGTALRRALRRR